MPGTMRLSAVLNVEATSSGWSYSFSASDTGSLTRFTESSRDRRKAPGLRSRAYMVFWVSFSAIFMSESWSIFLG